MFLRRLSTSASGALRRRRRGAKDDGVVTALRAEIAHELSSSPSSSSPPSLHYQETLGFATVSDAPRAQDVLVRRRGDAEEVHVSALLAPLRFEGEEPLPRDALMKVFVSKPGVEPLLRFDCRAVAAAGGAAAGYDITALSYHAFPGDGGGRKYEGPDFGLLDPKLQTALKEYLLARGVTPELATSLREHLLQKEQAQYVSWLKTLEGMFTKDH
ncbi:hypothetical protein D1007_46221 [Hordeum vulgare]|uniref:Predicted protein n=1 Tax=Hordeum vulgare subsp. vulgare TaxID=112509 RepID=F2CPP5_HORVV|nr:uncharacterized protein LOC123398128 isoform X1 [Hordeum vulgare subsp. vulgare]KAE8780588.1 hypothetical protein D1007_46221 [Hordeum vulgare]KAI4991832.1 hypothetical protein ZWY2020_040218 [Hordeum vulgare]BAJ84816.1 predicted protein [Hordeum vulgare subsp. vulgare]